MGDFIVRECPYCGGKMIPVQRIECDGFQRWEATYLCTACNMRTPFARRYKTMNEATEAALRIAERITFKEEQP